MAVIRLEGRTEILTLRNTLSTVVLEDAVKDLFGLVDTNGTTQLTGLPDDDVVDDDDFRRGGVDSVTLVMRGEHRYLLVTIYQEVCQELSAFVVMLDLENALVRLIQELVDYLENQ